MTDPTPARAVPVGPDGAHDQTEDGGKPGVTLFGRCLMSKWGFGDGEMPDALMDYWDDNPDDLGFPYNRIPWCDVLRVLVRRHLLPEVEKVHTVELYDIETAHNPIRARLIDGVEIDDYHGVGNPTVAVDVRVPYEDVMAAIREAMSRGDDEE